MLIFTADRDIILKTKPLFIVPNVKRPEYPNSPLWKLTPYSGKPYIASYNLYHGSDWIGNYETDTAARDEMDAINNCSDEVYFVGGYHGSDINIVKRLNEELRRYNGYADR